MCIDHDAEINFENSFTHLTYFQGDGQTICSVIEAIGSEYMTHSRTKLDEYLECHPTETKVLVRINGQRGTFSDGQWVPKDLRDLHALPENTGTFGSPWLLCHRKGAWCHGPWEIPFWGIGQWVIGVEGAQWLLMWPTSLVSDLAVDIEQGIHVLAAMKKDTLRTALDTQVKQFLIGEGTAVWVPYGWVHVIAQLQDGDFGYTLTVPYMSTLLCKQMDSGARKVVGKVLASYIGHDNVKGIKPWRDIGPAFLTWFDAMADVNPSQDDPEEDTAIGGHSSEASQALAAEARVIN